MSVPTSAPHSNLLDEESRAFVRRAMAGGLVELDDVKKVVASLLADECRLSPKRLAEGLVAAGMLTDWQAQKVLAGKSKGFHLGSYRLLRPLGRGGMGVVYLGEHQIMKRLMALKILPAEQLRDERRIKRFKDEARASAQLDHPNIVRAYDCAEAGGKVYIVMEYVDGANLHQAVVRDGVMPPGTAVDAIRQSAEGLAHAHARGIVHRDIKPSNLMLRRDGVLKVSDLGLARIGYAIDGSQENMKRLTGTADFVAPEQAIDSQSIDARADIYSLGCTFYYLLTGRPPFSGNNLQQRLAKHQTAPVPDIRSVNAQVPAAVADLIKRMMAKRPIDRPASMNDVLVELKQLRGVDGGRSISLRSFADSDDTSLSDVMLRATLSDDGGVSSGGSDAVLESGPLLADSLDGFDFSDLPDVPAPSSLPVSRPGPATAGSLSAGPHHRGGRSAASTTEPRSQGGQQILLGIGLALAVLALMAVLGMMAYTLNRPLENAKPRLKMTETKDEKGGTVIIVDDSP